MRIVVWAWTAMLSSALSAQTTDIHSILTASRQRIEASDFSLTGRLVSVEPGGTRVNYPITIKAHWFPSALRVMLAIASASKIGPGSLVSSRLIIHALLEMRPNGQIQIWIAHPGDNAPSVLPFEKWNDGPLGSNFSYEDFLESQIFWPEQAVLEQAKFGARDCDVVKSTPGVVGKTHYTDVKTWFDRSSLFPVYVEKTMKESGAVKEFTSYGVRHDQGVWSARQVELKIRGQAGSTLLIIDHGTVRAHLTLNDFSPAQLIRF